MATTQEIRNRSSQAAQTLERAWGKLRKAIPGLPAAVIVPLNVSVRRRRWGHFAASSWRARGPKQAHEIGVSPDLFSNAQALLETLLHEAAHAHLYENDPSVRHVGGVGKDGYYHRKEFQRRCEEWGLETTFLNRRYGWTLTRFPNGVPQRFAPVIAVLGRLPYGSGHRVASLPRGLSTTNTVSGQARLRCACPRTIYAAAKSVAQQGGVTCRLCGQDFEVPNQLKNMAFARFEPTQDTTDLRF